MLWNAFFEELTSFLVTKVSALKTQCIEVNKWENGMRLHSSTRTRFYIFLTN